MTMSAVEWAGFLLWEGSLVILAAMTVEAFND
jgi:hypothetical protein